MRFNPKPDWKPKRRKKKGASTHLPRLYIKPIRHPERRGCFYLSDTTESPERFCVFCFKHGDKPAIGCPLKLRGDRTINTTFLMLKHMAMFHPSSDPLYFPTSVCDAGALGKGVQTTVDVTAGTILCQFSGDEAGGKHYEANPERWMGLADTANHACYGAQECNAETIEHQGVGFLVASRDIPAGEQVFYDYCVTVGSIECKCSKCSKVDVAKRRKI
ncbi:hypothetical protein KIPB_001154 [Kipferlia bialata]|uniref:SET domain-containing protein n=1 Tax=Kipferlia bialata TaxID=797122 RepID=A0A9K3GFJ8_9EUKA|nr:hypothetical protein KIPB_001154 [Kipferlia bialata]|eukprot:g1154.t1